jgi:hypothetical protein
LSALQVVGAGRPEECNSRSRICIWLERIGNVPIIARDDLQPGLRTVPFEHSAVIAYVVEGDQVSVINVFYGGRDYDALYRGTERSEADQDE